MKFFVLAFDRSRDRLLHCSEFTEIDQALAALRIEETARQPEVEVVLLMGTSIEDLKITHGRYFMSPMDLVERWRARLLADGLVKTG